MTAIEKYDHLMAIDYFKDYLSTNLSPILGDNVDKFKNSDDPLFFHFSLGMYIRNRWKLWEDDESKKSDLVKFFNSFNIYHPDDMSSIIFTTYHRMLNGEDIDFDNQIKEYIDYWKKQGYEDGIPK